MKPIAVFLICLVAIAGVLTIVMSECFKGENGEGGFKLVADSLWNLAMNNDDKDSIQGHEASVVDLLHDYVAAQDYYNKKNGWYSFELNKLGVPDEMINAELGMPGSKGFHGYFFAHSAKKGEMDVDYVTEYALVAVPVKYRFTAINTYVVRQDGVVLKKDNRGKFVGDVLDLEDGTWLEVPMEEE